MIRDIDVRNLIEPEEFDYQTLMAVLSSYSNPRMKINSLLKRGVIIRVKKGIYVFGSEFRKRPFSKELLANWIYGPSIVSMDYMLSWYGLIPEAVTLITSSTAKRQKNFKTPVGDFVYKQVPYDYSVLGMCHIENEAGGFLAGTPERALADKVRETRGNNMKNLKETGQFLFDDLRIDQDMFIKLDKGLLASLAKAGRSGKIEHCHKLLIKMQKS